MSQYISIFGTTINPAKERIILDTLSLPRKNILFLVPYPLNESPSQRFRFEQYLRLLAQEGYVCHFQTFMDAHNWQYFFSSGNFLKKALALVKGFAKRCLLFFHVASYEWVFIHREVTPAGPPIFEWIIAKVFRKKIIYDFDDAIWLTDRKHESIFLRLIKWRSKVASICRWSYRVSAGNEYLCNFARQYNHNVVYNPTTIDTDRLHNPELYTIEKNPIKIVIGWTGSHSTLKYLKEIESALATLEKKYPQLELLVIADKPPTLSLTNVRFLPWSFETEIKGLLEADIGIMPLPDDEWAKGKCGFKALQYMALEIPAIISPVGVNKTIVESDSDGYFASTTAEWLSALETLINDVALRKRMGENGRIKIINQYSVRSNATTFLKLFKTT
jgi:glycosyltransferase involved in cell wall biosynthesis